MANYFMDIFSAWKQIIWKHLGVLTQLSHD